MGWLDLIRWFDLMLLAGVAEPVPTLPSPDAAGAGFAGSVCADAMAVAPNNAAATTAEIASLDRHRILLITIGDAGIRTCDPDSGSPYACRGP